MQENYLTGLFNHRVKKTAFVVAPLLFAMDISTYLIPGFPMNDSFQHILLNYGVILSLITIIGSRDKIDDELSRTIRYSVYKQTLHWTLAILCITTLFLAAFDITTLPTLIICYILEGVLILHIILYQIGIKYSPRWLLEEKEVPEHRSRAITGLLIAMTVVLILLYVLSFILD